MLNGFMAGLTSDSISIIVSVIFFSILLFSFFGGMIKGLRKSIFYTVFYVLFFVILFLVMRPIATFLIEKEWSFLENQNLYGFIKVKLAEIMKLDNSTIEALFADGSRFHLLISELSIALVKFAIIIVGIVVYFTIYRLFVWIVWLCAGRPFLKLNKKIVSRRQSSNDNEEDVDDKPEVIVKNKHAILGGLVGLIPGLMTCLIIFTPLDLVLHIANRATKESVTEIMDNQLDEPIIDDDILAMISDYLNGYNQSIPGKIYDNIKIGDNRLAVSMFDSLLTLKGKEENYHFASSVEEILVAAEKLLDTGAYETFSSKFNYELMGNYSTDQNGQEVKNAFEHFGKAKMINMIIDAAIDYLDVTTRIEKEPSTRYGVLRVNMNEIDFRSLQGINWCKDMSTLGKIAQSTMTYFNGITSENNLLDNLADNPTTFKELTNDLFDLDITKAAINIGAGVLLEDEKVVEIIGEIEVTDEEVIEDLNSLVDVVVEVANFGLSFEQWSAKDANIIKVLVDNTLHLKNIFETIFDLNIYKKVDEKLVTYMLETYIDKNEEVSKYIKSEDILACYDDNNSGIRHEVLNVITLLDDLKRDTVFLDGINRVETEVGSGEYKYELQLGEDSFNLKVAEAFSKSLENSIIIPKLLTSTFKYTLTEGENQVMNTEKFDQIMEDPEFSWSNELYFLGAVCENVNVLPMLNGGEIPISLKLIESLSAKNSSSEYYINKILLTKEILITTIEDTEDDVSLFTDIFSSSNLGLEMAKLYRIIETSEIADVDGNIELDNIEKQFKEKITTDLLYTFAQEVEGSEYLPNLLHKTLGDSLNEYVDTAEWDAKTWKNELNSLTAVLEDGEIADPTTHHIDVDNLSEKFETLTVKMLEALTDNVEDSILLKKMLKVELKSVVGDEFSFTNRNGTDWDGLKWRQEMFSLTASVKALLDEGQKEIDADNLVDNSKVKLNFLKVVKGEVSSSLMLQKILNDNLEDLVNPMESDQYVHDLYIDMAEWSDNQWESEVGSLVELAETICNFNNEDFVDVSSSESIFKDEFIPYSTLVAAKNNYSSILIQRQLTPVIDDDIAKEKNFTKTYIDTDAAWSRELNSLVVLGGDLKYRPANHSEDAIDKDIDLTTVKVSLLQALKEESKFSLLVRKLAKEPIDDMTNEGFTDNWDLHDDERWVAEIGALTDVGVTFKNAENKVELSNLNFDKLAMESVAAIRDSVNCYDSGNYFGDPSLIIVELSIDDFVDLMNTDITEESRKVKNADLLLWDGPKWEAEYDAIYHFTDTLEKDEDNKVAISEIDTNKLYMNSIKALRDNVEYSTTLQKCMRANLEKSMNKESMTITTTIISTEEWSAVQWKNELSAVYEIMRTKSSDVSGTINPDLTDDLLFIDIANFNADTCYPTTLDALSKYSELSIFARSQLRIPFARIMNVISDDFVDNWLTETGKWSNETKSLFALAKTMDRNTEDEIDLFNINYDEINVATIESASQNECELVIKMFERSIDESKTWIHAPSSDQWKKEVEALHSVSKTLANSDNKLVIAEINFDDTIRLDTIKALSSVIHQSTYMQGKLYPSLFKDGNVDLPGAPKIGYCDEYSQQWQDELDVLHYIFENSSFETAGKIEVKTVENGLKADVEIEVSFLQKVSERIHQSTYMQNKFRPTMLSLTVASGTNVHQLQRPQISAEYGVTEETILPITYQSYGQWNSELKSLIDLQLSLYPGQEKIIVDVIIQEMSQFKASILPACVTIFETYQDAILLQIMLLPTLEKIVNVEEITLSTFVNIPNGYVNFKWIDGGIHISDLTYFHEVMVILGLSDVGEVPTISAYSIAQLSNEEKNRISEINSKSLYVYHLFDNLGIAV